MTPHHIQWRDGSLEIKVKNKKMFIAYTSRITQKFFEKKYTFSIHLLCS